MYISLKKSRYEKESGVKHMSKQSHRKLALHFHILLYNVSLHEAELYFYFMYIIQLCKKRSLKYICAFFKFVFSV